jgi:RNA recognition motif-containing protein
MKIFIANLPYHISAENVRQLFELFGTVSYVKLPTQGDQRTPRGFGFLEMPDNEADLAIRELHGRELDGRNIAVLPAASQQQAMPQKHKRPRIPNPGRSLWKSLA